MSGESRLPKQLVHAGLLVVATTGFLLWRGRDAGDLAATSPSSSSTLSNEGPPREDTASPLIPDDAWLVLSVESSLFPASPFEGEGECDRVAPPERLEFAVLPPRPGGDDVSFFLAADEVSEAFSVCAERMIERNGGRTLGALGDIRRMRTPSGVFARSGRALAFSTEDGDGETAVRVLRTRSSRVLLERHPSLAERRSRLLVLSVAPEAGWLDGAARSLGADPARSPLAALRRLTFAVDREGEGKGFLDCLPNRCEELARFALRSVSDLVATLPPSLAPRLKDAIEIRYPVPDHPNAVGLSLDRAGLSLAQALLRYAVTPNRGGEKDPSGAAAARRSSPEPRKKPLEP